MPFTPLNGSVDENAKLRALEAKITNHRVGLDKMFVYLIRTVPSPDQVEMVLDDIRQALAKYNELLTEYSSLIPINNEEESL